jgi:hypothetical protein
MMIPHDAISLFMPAAINKDDQKIARHPMMQMCIDRYAYMYIYINIYSNRSAKLPTEAVLGRRDASLDCHFFIDWRFSDFRGFDSSAVSFVSYYQDYVIFVFEIAR